MENLNLVKKALEEGVVLFPKNFVEDNGVEAKFLGLKKGKSRGVKVYYIEALDTTINQIP